MLRSLFIAVILLLSACRETPNPPLRIAINPWPGYEFLYLAERLKLFEAEGVEVRILQFSSLNDSRRAFELGKADGFSQDYGHVDMLVSKGAQKEVWPLLAAWLMRAGKA